MKINQLKTNRIANPLGFLLNKPILSYIVSETEGTSQTYAQIEVATDQSFLEIIYDTGKRDDIDSLSYELPLELSPRKRYYWRVHVWANNGDYAVSDPAWFETAKMDEEWKASWISPNLAPAIHHVLDQTF